VKEKASRLVEDIGQEVDSYMLDKTQREILKTLFMPGSAKEAEGDPRIAVLVAMVFDLLMEVEALRTVVSASKLGVGGKDSAYGRAYQETAYLTHNACGPSSGVEKLLALFYPRQAEEEGLGWRERRTWRECLLMRRLGFSDDEVRAYKEEAEQAETFT
jgi:hypothetical protein